MCISQNVAVKRRPVAVKSSYVVPERIVSGSGRESKRHQAKYFHIVKHDYHDHSHDAPLLVSPSNTTDTMKKPVARGGVTTPFPEKLHAMLDEIEKDGLADVVSWQPHGRCFVVHKPKEFVSHIMPTYFKQSRYASFQRQLNLYGFVRLTKKGQDKNGYYHEYFLRGKPELCRSIHRIKVKGTGVRARSNPDTEPDFYAMPPIDDVVVPSTCQQPTTVSSSSSSLQEDAPPAARPLYEQQQDDDDDVLMFEGKPFHYLDPFDLQAKPLVPVPPPPQVSEDEEEESDGEMFSRSEMEEFLHDLNLPSDLYHDIVETVEGDEGLGHLLERIIE